MPRPTRPTDVLVANGWYFEMQGLISPHFSQLSGISVSSGEVKVVDGATNIVHKFSSQLKDFGDISLERAYDGSVDDDFMRALQALMINTGTRVDGNLVKLHRGVEVFRILFLGMGMKKVAHPTLKTDSEDAYIVAYDFSVSEWVEIPA